jgi:hypothetical protein
MKILSILFMASITLSISGQDKVKTSSTPVTAATESLRRDLIASKTKIDAVIAPWQKNKLVSVGDKLQKMRISPASGNNQIDVVRKEVKAVFFKLTDKQTDFFTAYILGYMHSSGSQAPDWVKNTLQKQQQLIQMLSNVTKILEDEGTSTIRKIGCSGSECDD